MAGLRLADLEPQLLRYQTDGERWDAVPDLGQAHGVMFFCPKCFAENRGSVGTHMVLCWFRGLVPASATPGPGRWDPSGTGLADLTLSPSVHLSGPGCGWHGFVRAGAIVGT